MPAVLAAAKHCYPQCGLERCAALASAWLREQDPGSESAGYWLKLYSRDRDGANLYVLCAAVPPILVERTLSGLAAVLYATGRLIVVSSLPVFRWRYKRRKGRLPVNSRGLNGFWIEIEAAVTQARLQASVLVNNESC